MAIGSHTSSFCHLHRAPRSNESSKSSSFCQMRYGGRAEVEDKHTGKLELDSKLQTVRSVD